MKMVTKIDFADTYSTLMIGRKRRRKRPSRQILVTVGDIQGFSKNWKKSWDSKSQLAETMKSSHEKSSHGEMRPV